MNKDRVNPNPRIGYYKEKLLKSAQPNPEIQSQALRFQKILKDEQSTVEQLLRPNVASMNRQQNTQFGGMNQQLLLFEAIKSKALELDVNSKATLSKTSPQTVPLTPQLATYLQLKSQINLSSQQAQERNKLKKIEALLERLSDCKHLIKFYQQGSQAQLKSGSQAQINAIMERIIKKFQTTSCFFYGFKNTNSQQLIVARRYGINISYNELTSLLPSTKGQPTTGQPTTGQPTTPVKPIISFLGHYYMEMQSLKYKKGQELCLILQDEDLQKLIENQKTSLDFQTLRQQYDLSPTINIFDNFRFILIYQQIDGEPVLIIIDNKVNREHKKEINVWQTTQARPYQLQQQLQSLKLLLSKDTPNEDNYVIQQQQIDIFNAQNSGMYTLYLYSVLTSQRDPDLKNIQLLQLSNLKKRLYYLIIMIGDDSPTGNLPPNAVDPPTYSYLDIQLLNDIEQGVVQLPDYEDWK